MNAAFSQNQAGTRRPSAGRMLLAAIMLLALTVQGYVTQTHIHPQDFAATGIVLKTDGSAGQKNIPANDDPARCPICQQIAQAGLFMAPAWLLPFLALSTAAIFEFAAFLTPHYDKVSHN
jgi:hypothetical protein